MKIVPPVRAARPEVGPAADLRLGDKKARHGRSEDDDVEIAEVIRNDQAARRRLAFHRRLDVQAAIRLPRRHAAAKARAAPACRAAQAEAQ